MIRKIEVMCKGVKIRATLNTQGLMLSRSEAEAVRDALADRLQDAAAQLPYLHVPRNRVRVR